MAPEYSHPERQLKPARDCAALESLLTAFFDGECSAAEAACVRTHLDSCPSCARSCEQWQSTRALFQSTPLPAPPASLLARVRLACRRAPASAETIVEAEIRDQLLLEETLLEAARGLEPEPFTPVLRAFFAESTPPATLKDEILRKTVGTPVNVRDADAALKSGLTTNGSTLLESLHALLSPVLTPGSVRWASALAVPAIAAWLILLPRVDEVSVVQPQQSSQNQARRATVAGILPTAPDLKSLLQSRIAMATKSHKPVPAPNATTSSRIAAKPVETTASPTHAVQVKSTLSSTVEEETNLTPESRIIRITTDPHPTAVRPPAAKLVDNLHISKAPPRLARRPEFDPRIREQNISERAYSPSPASLGRASVRLVSFTTAPQGSERVAAAPVPRAVNLQKVVEEFRISRNFLRNPPDEGFSSVVNDYRNSLANADQPDDGDDAADDDADDLL